MERAATRGSRHQWGPAPSGSNQHTSVCRRCGLREVTEWYDAPGGATEITMWVTPRGEVVGSRRVDSHQAPPRHRPLEVIDAVADQPPEHVVQRCPGHLRAWSGSGETLGA